MNELINFKLFNDSYGHQGRRSKPYRHLTRNTKITKITKITKKAFLNASA